MLVLLDEQRAHEGHVVDPARALEVLDEVLAGRARVWRRHPHPHVRDCRRHQIGLVAVAAINRWAAHSGLLGHARDGHPRVALAVKEPHRGLEDGLVDGLVERPSGRAAACLGRRGHDVSLKRSYRTVTKYYVAGM